MPRRIVIWASALAATATAGAAAAQTPAATFELIAKARAELAGPAGTVWPGWAETPFGVLLVDGEREHLLCQEAPGFDPPAAEPATGCEVRSRARVFPPGLQAAMPAFGLPATVVVGTPAATRKQEAAWRATLLHEHFHQHQWSFPRYGERVNALDLSGGDQTGMWMLNYAFPYEQAETARRFADAGAALHAVLQRPGRVRSADVAAYLRARDTLAGSVPARDWRYAEFQLWQEGVARWTEFTAAELSMDAAVQAAGRRLRAATMDELSAAELAKNERVALYALGAGEAMLLDRCGPRWKARYPAVMAMRPLLAAALEDCTGR